MPELKTVAQWRAQQAPAANPHYLALSEHVVAGLRKAGLADP